MNKLLAQIAKFGIVGIFATVIDFAILIVLTELFGVDTVVSATISFSISVVFNYLASMRYVFKHRDGLSRQREFAVFLVLSMVGLIINDVMMWMGTEFTSVDYRIVKVVATFVVMIWNFVTRKVFLEEKGVA